MATQTLAAETMRDMCEAVPHLLRLPSTSARIDYDREADVLYISLRRPQRASATRFVDEEGILLRYRGSELVGITILNASKRGVAEDT